LHFIHYKANKIILYLIYEKRKNMVKIVNFVYIMIIILLSAFLIVKNVDGKSFLSFTNFLNYFFFWFKIFLIITSYTTFFHQKIIYFLSFFITATHKCFQDSHCPPYMCPPPIIPRCVNGSCTCIIKRKP
jgi:hypothetical protein